MPLGDFIYSTTTGVIDHAHSLDILNIVIKRTWPIINHRSSAAEHEDVKRRALTALEAHLLTEAQIA